MLLTRPKPQSDECLVSYLIRVSEQNGFKHIGHLLNHAGLKWKNNRAPIHQILSGEFDVAPLMSALGLAEHTSSITLLCQSLKRVIDTPNILTKHPKVCPECLEELGYCKYHWALLPIVACTKHKKMLVDISSTSGKKLGWYRQHVNQIDGENEYIKPSKIIATPRAIQQSLYIESLISGKKSSSSVPVVLLGLEFREALSLIHFITHYQTRVLDDSFKPAGMQNNELAQNYQTTWESLQEWPDSFYALLAQYVDKPMSKKGLGGLTKHFRDLYQRLHRQQENQGIARIKTEFDRYVEQYWPGVLEAERISRIQLTSTTRNIISKKETANILGSRLPRVDRLVLQGRLTQVVFKGKAHYQRDQVMELAGEFSANWTMNEACEALEITRYQLKQLLDAGVIPVLQKPDDINRDWIINKAQCLSMTSELQSKARNFESFSDTVSMAGIQRQGYSIVRLILAMQSGELEYCASQKDGVCASLKQFTAFKV